MSVKANFFERPPSDYLGVGAAMNIFQVSTLGQPLENIKTYLSANRNATLGEGVRSILARGPIRGFYQGLIPWVWSLHMNLLRLY